MKRFKIAAVATLLLVSGSAVYAQQEEELPACASVAADPDGDGFGFENQQSCQIDSSSAPKPEYVNPQTGQPVTLIRAYWNANRDIAERSVSCKREVFDPATASFVGSEFVARPFGSFAPTHTYTHQPVPYTEPYIGNVSSPDDPAGVAGEAPPAWTVDNGIYLGVMPLHNEPWVEVINLPDTGQSAVRVWRPEEDDADLNLSYYQCEDVNGESFEPTGFPGESSTPTQAAPDTDISISGPAQSAGSSDAIVNLQTGLMPDIQPVYWNLQRDILGKSATCSEYAWGGEIYLISPLETYQLVFHPQLTSDSPAGIVSVLYDYDYRWQPWQVSEEGVLLIDGDQSFPVMQDAELIDDNDPTLVRFWLNSESYYQCEFRQTLGLTGQYRSNDFRFSDSLSLEPSGSAPVDGGTTDPEPADNPDDTADPADATSGGGGVFSPGWLLLVSGLIRSRRRRGIRSVTEQP